MPLGYCSWFTATKIRSIETKVHRIFILWEIIQLAKSGVTMKIVIFVLACVAALSHTATAFHALPHSISLRPLYTKSHLTMAMGKEAPVNRRRIVQALIALPLVGLRTDASAATMTGSEELAKQQAEAARIQEFFDVQKELNSNMPSLKEGMKKVADAQVAEKTDTADSQVAKAKNDKADAVDPKSIVSVVDDMMKSLKDHGEGGMRTVLSYSAPGNPIKDMPFQNVINSMRDSAYALLLAKFTTYEIKNPEMLGVDEDEGLTHSRVDVIVKAPYTTILQNGVQFTEVTLATVNSPDKLCSVTFRWNMCQGADGKWVSEGCYVIPADESEA